MNRLVRDRLARAVNTLEESVIALLLAGMTLVTFSQVVARYIFNAGAVWALELTLYLFAWLVLFGISYGIKIGAHLGVDAFVKLLPGRTARILAVCVCLACTLYAGILIWGAWKYVSLMWMIGIRTEDLHLPRWLVYSSILVGMGLFALRCLQAAWQVAVGKRDSIIAGHEVENLITEMSERAEGGSPSDGRPGEENRERRPPR